MTKKNKSMVVVNETSISVKRPLNSQSAFRNFFNESALLENCPKEDLLQLYRKKIQNFEERYALNVPYKLFRIWNNKDIDCNKKYIDLESPTSLVARYMIALGSELYKTCDYTELLFLIGKRLHLDNDAYSDGLKLIHKIIAFGNSEIFGNFVKVGCDLTTFTSKGEYFLPCNPPVTKQCQPCT